MRPITRREALRIGVVGGVAAVVGGAGLTQTGLPWDASAARAGTFLEPETLQGVAGVLRVDLVASRREVSVAGQRANLLTYSGTVPGNTWRVRPGDRIEVRLRNDLESPTNLHTHGLAVSPRDNGDNPFVSIEPGQSHEYRFDLPPDHPPGTFWYHPHRHGLVADQLFGGLYGALIVDGDEVPTTRERVLLVSDISLTADGQIAPTSTQDIMMGREGDLLLVNGQREPHLTARPGERERWRVVNACSSRYLRLELAGQQVELLGIDTSQGPPEEATDVLLAPGNRADLLVTMQAGTSELRTLGYDRGRMGMMGGGNASGPGTLATLTVSGDEVIPPAAVPERPGVVDLRGQPIARKREIAFTMEMGGMMGPGGGAMNVGFDGLAFDHERVDQEVSAGTIEEWVISNPTPMDHPFHLHVWRMQLIEAGSQPTSDPTWRDVVNVPAGSRVRVLIDFSRNPGRSVYHCHILDHEDAGMMAVVDVS